MARSRAQVSYPIGNSGLLAVGDLNGDGKPDVVAVSVPFIRPAGSQLISGTIAVLLNNGDGTFQPPVKYGVGEGVYSVSMGDFNGDGKTDLAVINGFGVMVLLGNGDGTFRNPLTYGAAKLYAAVGDLNGDGKPDLVTVNALDNGVAVLLNTYIPGNGGSACATVQPFGN
jgi:FG-GAP-like repeat/FG-GAP repeat